MAAALEWAVAFILPFYFLTLAADLWPAGKSSPRYMRRLARWQEKHDPHSEHDFTGRRAFAERPEAWQGADGHALDPNAPVAPAMMQNNSQEMASARPSTAYGSEAGLVQPHYNTALSSAPITHPSGAPAGAGPDGATFNAHTGTWNA